MTEQLEQYVCAQAVHVAVDKKPAAPVSSSPKSIKGGEKSARLSRRTRREEMREW